MDADVNDLRPLLVPWHTLVAAGKSLLTLDENGAFIESESLESPNGTFAIYDEGVFAVWVIRRETIFVQANQQVAQVFPTDELRRGNEIRGRHFAVLRDGVPRLTFDYKTFRSLMKRPWKLIQEILAPDDDWGLVADLPSFVHSHYKNPELILNAISYCTDRAREVVRQKNHGGE